jgi:hypothetical protein
VKCSLNNEECPTNIDLVNQGFISSTEYILILIVTKCVGVQCSLLFNSDIGEKLSKKQLQLSNTIKKLRAKEKENESLITSQK